MSDSESQGDDFVWPRTCSICKGPFVNLTITKCNHFFCEPCIKKHHEKYGTCFVCKKPTSECFRFKMHIFRDPVGPEEIAVQRKKAQVEKKAVLESLREELEMTTELKIGMMKEGVLAEKAVKIAGEVETLLEKAIEKAMKADETVGAAFEMLCEARDTCGTAEAKLCEAVGVMANLKHKD